MIAFLDRLKRQSRNCAACPICGGSEFSQHSVLGRDLIDAWGLSSEEVAYVERQQGLLCHGCGSNLRSRTMAAALLEHAQFPGTLRAFVSAHQRNGARILELNEAGTLSLWLAKLKRHTLACYPEVDMLALPYPDDSWDIVIHSDVLEHVSDPLQALKECRRVLSPSGVLIYTIPVIYGRLTRDRQGLPACHHGAAGEARPDMVVYTEYGADFWLHPMAAGFRNIRLSTLTGPESIALVCKK